MDANERQSLLEPSTNTRKGSPTNLHSNRKKFLILLLATISSFLCLAFNENFDDQFIDNFLKAFTEISDNQVADTCIFPEFDIFDPEIMKVVYYYFLKELLIYYYEKTPVCNVKRQNMTALRKRKLLNNQPREFECWGRCHIFKNGNETFAGNWYHTNQNHSFNCDIVETRCSKNRNITNAYYFMHSQIVEVSPTKPKVSPVGKQYDVYFIVVDCQSHSQMFRNLNKTNEFLLNKMEATSFPHINRIGGGSRPNGIAWFYGKITERVDRSPYNMSSLEPEPKWRTYCSRKLDNETMIINEFGDYGYMTAHIADWFRTVDYGCVGADDQFAHHTYTPYSMTYQYNPQLSYFMGKKQCIHKHEHALDYLGQFVDSYKDKPKMAFVWLSHVGHNTERGSTDADPHFLELFENRKEKFDNSFVFLVGDHGLRHTDAVNTKVGSIDINNPALIMTVPKVLRGNKELMKTLRENAKELQTHYDTRATLLDILKFQPAVNYADHSLKAIKGELGNSFFRQQPKPRTCQTLPIPPSYCLCENQMKQDILKKNPDVSHLIGKKAVDLINLRLSNNTKVNQCRKWIFNTTQKLEQFSKSPTFSAQGSFSVTNDRKLEASFQVFLSGKNESSLEIVSLTRVDSYKESGNCVTRSFQSICDCY